MGDARDRALDKAQELAHKTLEKASDAVKHLGAEDKDWGPAPTGSGEDPERG